MKRTVDPTELPITLAEVKAHLRVTSAEDDAIISSYIRSAVSQLDGNEGILNGRALISQTWEMTLDMFPMHGFDIPLSPLQSVTEIAYIDGSGVEQTLSTDVYDVLNTNSPMKRGRVVRAFNKEWPVVRFQPQAITVTFVAGFGNRNAIPDYIRSLIFVMVKEMYDNREALNNVSRSVAFESLLGAATFPTRINA